MKTILFLFFILCTFNYCFGRAGFAEVVFDTPGGHMICHCDPYDDHQTPILAGWDKLEKLEKWYFFHGNIIGIGNDYFFIFNEKNEHVQYFKNEVDWHKAIDDQKLSPTFTRWFTLSDSPDMFCYFLIITSPISIPIILFLISILVVLSYKKIIVWNKITWAISLGALFGTLVFIYSQFYLESF